MEKEKCYVCNIGRISDYKCTHCGIRFCPKCNKVNDLTAKQRCHCPPPVTWISDEAEPE